MSLYYYKRDKKEGRNYKRDKKGRARESILSEVISLDALNRVGQVFVIPPLHKRAYYMHKQKTVNLFDAKQPAIGLDSSHSQNLRNAFRQISYLKMTLSLTKTLSISIQKIFP